MRKIIAGLVGFGTAVAVWVSLAAPAAAQSGERITSYAVDIDVRRDGRIVVRETIDYDFGDNERHGIYRHIPVRARYDDEFDRIYPIDDIKVDTERGTPDDLDVSDESNSKVIRIGDEDRTITGRHRYVITYEVTHAVSRFEAHDELYWNAIGTEWDVPIEKASVVVRAAAPISEVACYTGGAGSQLGCDESRRDGSRATFGQSGLTSGNGVTIVVALPHRYAEIVGPKLDQRWSAARAFSVRPETTGVSALVLLAGLGGVGRLLWRRGRDRHFAGEIPGLEPPPGVAAVEQPRPLWGNPEAPIEYLPPDGMRPALMGVLLDEHADALDVSATIVDLAVRRYIRIEELPRKGLFRRRDWKLVELEKPDDPNDELTPWEAKLLLSLFAGPTEVVVSSLKKTFHDELLEVQELLYEDVVKKGWFTRRPDKDRGLWFVAGLVATGAGAGLLYVIARWTTWGLVGIPLVLTGLALLAVHKKLPFRTARGSAALARAEGFRRYLATAEAEQLRFEEREGVFSRYLPYAVVLGETERWADAFAKIGLKPEESLYWYHGPSGWTMDDFSDSVSEFSTSTAGTLAASPGGSSGSGFSGGFSGGGGGGGGGSW